MQQNDNRFEAMIENSIIVANNQLKIEKTSEYLVADVHSQRGFFAYEDELSVYANTMSSGQQSIAPRASAASIASSVEEQNHY